MFYAGFLDMSPTLILIVLVYVLHLFAIDDSYYDPLYYSESLPAYS
jgi:hypothetical protein